jgi:hypothetical protein
MVTQFMDRVVRLYITLRTATHLVLVVHVDASLQQHRSNVLPPVTRSIVQGCVARRVLDRASVGEGGLRN